MTVVSDRPGRVTIELGGVGHVITTEQAQDLAGCLDMIAPRVTLAELRAALERQLRAHYVLISAEKFYVEHPDYFAPRDALTRRNAALDAVAANLSQMLGVRR